MPILASKPADFASFVAAEASFRTPWAVAVLTDEPPEEEPPDPEPEPDPQPAASAVAVRTRRSARFMAETSFRGAGRIPAEGPAPRVAQARKNAGGPGACFARG